MNEKTINAIRARALTRSTQTDFAKWGNPPLPAPASLKLVLDAESELGFSFWHDHRQVLMEIANGGFGPGDGLFGLPISHGEEGHLFGSIRSMITTEIEPNSPVIPICDWGSGIWSCIDCQTGEILTLDERGLTLTEIHFTKWMENWAEGKNLFDDMYHYEEVELVDPKTLKKAIVHKFGRAKGMPYCGKK